jgi:cell division protein FtsB
MTSQTTPEETGKTRTGNRLLAGLALSLAAVLVLVLIFSHRGLYQIYRIQKDRGKIEQENARLAEENARLARTIDRLHNDPEMIQDLIRRELNFVKKNEVIFQLPPGQGQSPSPTAPVAAAPSSGPPPKSGAESKEGKKRFAWEQLEGAPPKAGRASQR